jgi:rfaE bifunctional protein nucleotidyltransferase chain/domain
MDYQQKIKSLSTLKKIVGGLKKEGKKIVTTNGCFDLLHPGHIIYLNQAKKQGDVLIVGLNSDTSVKKIKGKTRPILNEKDRALMLASLEMVDYVVIFPEENPIAFLKALKPHLHLKGGDYQPEEMVEYKTVKEGGGEVKTVPFVKGYSTTALLKKILQKHSLIPAK